MAKKQQSKKAKKLAATIKNYTNIKFPGAFSNESYFLKGVQEKEKEAAARTKKKRGRKPEPVTQSALKRALEQDYTYQTGRSLRKHFKRRRDLSFGMSERWECDIADFGPSRLASLYGHKTKRTRYALITVDIFSKVCRARGLKDKSAASVVTAMRSIFQDLEPPLKPPSTLVCDKGREFNNAQFKKLLEEHHVFLSLSGAYHKAKFAERYELVFKKYYH